MHRSQNSIGGVCRQLLSAADHRSSLRLCDYIVLKIVALPDMCPLRFRERGKGGPEFLGNPLSLYCCLIVTLIKRNAHAHRALRMVGITTSFCNNRTPCNAMQMLTSCRLSPSAKGIYRGTCWTRSRKSFPCKRGDLQMVFLISLLFIRIRLSQNFCK